MAKKFFFFLLCGQIAPGDIPPVLGRRGDGGISSAENFFILNLPQGSNLAHLWEGDGGRGRLALAKVMNQATVLV